MRDGTGMPLSRDILSKKVTFEAEPELRRVGKWVCLNIEPTFPWPARPQSAELGGQALWLMRRGAAPLYRGQPSYRPEMDGDGDGIVCEPYRPR